MKFEWKKQEKELYSVKPHYDTATRFYYERNV